MTTSNPFRQPLRRGEVDFHVTVHHADATGKDRSSGSATDFAINRDYLWIASDFSVPLAWIESAAPVGPGFAVIWQSPLTGKRERATLCARRLFGYNLKQRDELVARINAARVEAKKRPAPVVVASAAVTQVCERCGAPNAITCDYVYVVTFLLLFVSKPDRRIFCPHHARIFSALNAAANFVLGSLRIAIIFAPMATVATTRRLKYQRVLSPAAAYATITFALMPYLLVLWYIVYLIRPH